MILRRWKVLFLESKPEHLAAWDTDLVRAIRDHDLDALRARNTTTQSLQASNAFGESIVHLCARRETAEMLRFLVERT